MEQPTPSHHQRIKLSEINSYLMCQLCRGYLIDATTISECLHSFCRSCIINFLQDNSHCPVCEVIINKAKPNLKLDKTLQDVVYKLVPELFLKEMTRRQVFYQQHPNQACGVSPEQRGEDTERTIFNARDTFSLSIEYISDESTPGAILLPSSKPNILANIKNGKNGLQKSTESSMKRYLQCPGMCRVDVLKKFVRNKYNVNTYNFQIDVLYKRVPLPDHYTLIDIAYIYSWKRNEPMKFFFRITDVNLVKERFDYLEPQVKLDPLPQQASAVTPKIRVVVKTKAAKSVRFASCVESNKIPKRPIKINTPPPQITPPISQDLIINKSSDIKTKQSDVKPAVYTNITLNRANNVEIITKIQKVSNKNGQPIGLNIIKTVKKPVNNDLISDKVINDSKATNDIKENDVKVKDNKVIEVKVNGDVKVKPDLTVYDFDDEKERFLKSIELTSKSVIHTIAKSQKSEAVKAEALRFLAQKRKSSPYKYEKVASAKKAKLTPRKKIKGNTKKLGISKVIEVKSDEEPKSSENLKSLLNTCKIPSSLSITCVNGERETQMKPVINHIEILKLPDLNTVKVEPKNDIDEHKLEIDLEHFGTTMQATNKSEEVKNEPLICDKPEISISLSDVKNEPQRPLGVHPNLPKLPQPQTLKLNSRANAQTFQKMFEEAIKRPEFAQKADGSPSNSNKRNILEIASELQAKKSKLEAERAAQLAAETATLNTNSQGKVQIPRLNNAKHCKKPPKIEIPKDLSPNSARKFQQTVANLHSASLGLNYSVSVNQKGDNLIDDLNKINLGSSPRVPNYSPYARPNSQSPSFAMQGTLPLEAKASNKLLPKAPHNKMQISPLATNKSSQNKTKLPLSSPKIKTSSPLASPKLQDFTQKLASPKLQDFTQKSLPSPKLQDFAQKSLASPKLQDFAQKSLASPKLQDFAQKSLASPKLQHTSSPMSPKIHNSSPKSQTSSPISLASPKLQSPSLNSLMPQTSMSPKLPSSSLRPLSSPSNNFKPLTITPNALTSPNHTMKSVPLSNSSPNYQSMPKSLVSPGAAKNRAQQQQSPKQSYQLIASPKQSPATSRDSRKSPALGSPKLPPSTITKDPASTSSETNQLLEKYNIPNLAQLTASFNFNSAAAMGLSPANQIAAFQQAMILKHFEMQNRQNWLSMNANPIAQYEKYLQSLNANSNSQQTTPPNQLLGNIKEN